MNKFFPAVLILSCLILPAFGQEPDTLAMEEDSIYRMIEQAKRETFLADSLRADSLRAEGLQSDSVLNEFDYSHSPLKATLYALVLPGLGQAYNKKYYKIPIVWAGLGGMVYFIKSNTKYYNEAIAIYQENPNSSTEWVLTRWRRYVELSYIGLVVVYALQVLDAYVDAQLYNWNVTENLSMGVSPSLQPMMHPASLTGQAVGLTCSIKIRGR